MFTKNMMSEMELLLNESNAEEQAPVIEEWSDDEHPLQTVKYLFSSFNIQTYSTYQKFGNAREKLI
jgi:hypothetical protein